MNTQAMHSSGRASAVSITVSISVEMLNALNKFVGSEELLFETTKPLGVKG